MSNKKRSAKQGDWRAKPPRPASTVVLAREGASGLEVYLLKRSPKSGFFPGNYVFLHHVFPEYLLYAPSYVIAAIRVAELNRYLTAEVGEEWWSQKKTAGIITEMMAAHGKVEFSDFSKLDIRPYIEDFCRIG